jgi:hypothetical protein
MAKEIDRTGRAEENYVQVQAKDRLSPREPRHRKRILFSICDDGDPRKETDAFACCCCFFYQIRPATLWRRYVTSHKLQATLFHYRPLIGPDDLTLYASKLRL